MSVGAPQQTARSLSGFEWVGWLHDARETVSCDAELDFFLIVLMFRKLGFSEDWGFQCQETGVFNAQVFVGALPRTAGLECVSCPCIANGSEHGV